MSSLKEAIEFSRTQQLEAAAAEEARRRTAREAEEAKRRERHEAKAQAFSESQQILDEGSLQEVLNEVNQELFGGNGKFFTDKHTVTHAGTYGLSEIDYWTGIGIKGRIGKKPVMLIAEGGIFKPEHPYTSNQNQDPILRVSCRTEEPRGKLGVLSRGVKWEEWGESTALRIHRVEGQEEPTREWQDINQVRQSFAKVIVAKGLV